MNWKVLLILSLTIIAVVILSLISFTPLSQNFRSSRTNSDSLKPSQPVAVTVPKQGKETFRTYTNKDRTENYFSIQLPEQWTVTSSGNAGGYALQFNGGHGSIELMDVPDNSTLELFVLSQEEPRLKSSLQGYQKIDYQKKSVNGTDAYQLTYLSTVHGVQTETQRTYVTGQDMTNVITLDANKDAFASEESLFTTIVQSFQWNNH